MDSLEDMFPWQTSYCSSILLNDCIDDNVVGPDVVDLPSFDGMLVDMEMILAREQADAYEPCRPSPIPLSPLNSPMSTQLPVQASVDPSTVNTSIYSLQVGTREIKPQAPSSPLSSAPDTPPVEKPKRSRAGGPAKSKPSSLKAKKAPAELRPDDPASKAKANRVPTKADHIIRERQRRDDMATKYSTLESLLPPASKRERAVLVGDAISYVGALQQKVSQLLKRRADLKGVVSSCQSPRCKKGRTWEQTPLCEPPGTLVNPPCTLSKQRSALENCKSESPLSVVQADPPVVTSDGVVQADPPVVTSCPTEGSNSIRAINVHLGKEEIIVEITWSRPRLDFQSTLLQAVESLGLDVITCKSLRVGKDYIQCFLTCTKSQVLSQRMSEIQSSSTMIIRALKNVLTQN